MLRTFLSFVALQNIGTFLQCILDCDQFTPNLPATVCRHISLVNFVLFCIRMHSVFAVNRRAAHALNGTVSAVHFAFLLYEKPQNVTPALGLQMLLSGLTVPLSIYSMIFSCGEDSEVSSRPERRKVKRTNEALVSHLRSQLKDKDI